MFTFCYKHLQTGGEKHFHVNWWTMVCFQPMRSPSSCAQLCPHFLRDLRPVDSSDHPHVETSKSSNGLLFQWQVEAADPIPNIFEQTFERKGTPPFGDHWAYNYLKAQMATKRFSYKSYRCHRGIKGHLFLGKTMFKNRPGLPEAHQFLRENPTKQIHTNTNTALRTMNTSPRRSLSTKTPTASSSCVASPAAHAAGAAGRQRRRPSGASP